MGARNHGAAWPRRVFPSKGSVRGVWPAKSWRCRSKARIYEFPQLDTFTSVGISLPEVGLGTI